MNKYQEAWENILNHDDKANGIWTPTVKQILLENERYCNLTKEVALIQKLIDKQTNHKTLEELGYIKKRSGNPNIVDFMQKNTLIYINIKYKEYYVTDINNLDVPVSYKLHKAIELKMIELGVWNDV